MATFVPEGTGAALGEQQRRFLVAVLSFGFAMICGIVVVHRLWGWQAMAAVEVALIAAFAAALVSPWSFFRRSAVRFEILTADGGAPLPLTHAGRRALGKRWMEPGASWNRQRGYWRRNFQLPPRSGWTDSEIAEVLAEPLDGLMVRVQPPQNVPHIGTAHVAMRRLGLGVLLTFAGPLLVLAVTPHKNMTSAVLIYSFMLVGFGLSLWSFVSVLFPGAGASGPGVRPSSLDDENAALRRRVAELEVGRSPQHHATEQPRTDQKKAESGKRREKDVERRYRRPDDLDLE